MKAEVHISRVHKGSPYNIQAVLFDVEGKDEFDILSNPKVLKTLRKTFGRKLKVSIYPLDNKGCDKPHWREYYITKEQNNYNITQEVNHMTSQNKETMKTLINITQQNGKRAVSARELHQFLEVKTDFKDWMPRMLEYGFEEGLDFSSFLSESKGGRPAKDYVLTIDTAKEIAMIQRTPKGKEARQYFIEMEKVALNKVEAPQLHKVNCNSVYDKRVELLKLIKDLLQWGDVQKVALELGVNNSYVKQVLYKFNNTEKSDLVLNALYQKAMRNKNELLFSYQEMIDMLKN
nr:antA/AntB antirepressor family protein [Chryseobacterium scophthalmum]